MTTTLLLILLVCQIANLYGLLALTRWIKSSSVAMLAMYEALVMIHAEIVKNKGDNDVT